MTQLYEIDLLSGAETQIGDPGVSGDFEGLAFAPDGQLYAIDDSSDQLCRIDVGSGAPTRRLRTLSRLDRDGVAWLPFA